MSLSKHQIEQIKKFIHSRGFTHIEVEMEILDHVASAVEEKLEKDPRKSLDQAIQEVHAGFEPLGFSTFEDTIHESINKMLSREFWRTWKYYLIGSGLPTTFIILAISVVVGIAFLPTQSETFFRFFFNTLGMIVFIYCLIIIKIRSKDWLKKSAVVSLTGGYTTFVFIFFGQGAGMLVQAIFQLNNIVGVLVFGMFSMLTMVYGLTFLKLFNFSFNWAQERYLKYA